MKTFDNYPPHLVGISILFSLAVYCLGIYILSWLGTAAVVFYIAYILLAEFLLVKKACVNCYYYGKWCGVGRGKLAVFLKKGSPKRFCEKKISWVDIIPDFIVMLAPVLAGIIILIRDFSWGTLIAMLLLAFLSFYGNMAIRTGYVCKYCRQRKICCPASEMFK